MATDIQIHRCRFQFSLRTLLLIFIPVALLSGLAVWLFRPPPIDVEVTVERFSWYKATDGNGVGLGAEVRITNRSKHTVWHLEYPRYFLLELVDGKWLESFTGTKMEPDWWSSHAGMQSYTVFVGPISEKATEIKVAIPFTTDRFMPKAHLVFSPVVKMVKKGKDYFPEVKEETTCNADDQNNEGHLPPAKSGQGN